MELSAIIADIAARVATVSPMRKSGEDYYHLRQRSPEHCRFAIDAPEEESAEGQRQRTEILVRYDVRLLWAYELPAPVEEERVDRVGVLTDMQRQILIAVMSLAPGAAYRIDRYSGASRTAGPNAWIWTEMKFRVFATQLLS